MTVSSSQNSKQHCRNIKVFSSFFFLKLVISFSKKDQKIQKAAAIRHYLLFRDKSILISDMDKFLCSFRQRSFSNAISH